MWRINIFLFSLLLCLLATPVLADKKAPIHIEADTVELDEKTGTSTYSGNVKLTQANLSIKADNISVFTANKTLQKILATGSPAVFTQTNEEKSLPPVNASSSTIEYDASSDTLTLIDNVNLTQGDNSFSGDVIYYDISNNVMKAQGKKKTGRVQATIQLEKIKQ